MPARNVVKEYVEGEYYHVYNRVVEKRAIFLDDEDYRVFMNLLKRHLSREREPLGGRRGVYESFYGRLELQAFCLMPNHFHMLIYLNNDTTAITELLRRVCGSYTTYFNKKYERVGYLFQGVFKASRISSNEYLTYITRYIHRNPIDYNNWEYSSLPSYIKGRKVDWIVPDRVCSMFEMNEYESFVNDEQGSRWAIDEILVGQLADG
jgi:putative transposase